MKKKKLPPTGMAARYESAWNQVVTNLPPWKKILVIEEPFGRHANDAALHTSRLAECNDFTGNYIESSTLEWAQPTGDSIY